MSSPCRVPIAAFVLAVLWPSVSRPAIQLFGADALSAPACVRASTDGRLFVLDRLHGFSVYEEQDGAWRSTGGDRSLGPCWALAPEADGAGVWVAALPAGGYSHSTVRPEGYEVRRYAPVGRALSVVETRTVPLPPRALATDEDGTLFAGMVLEGQHTELLRGITAGLGKVAPGGGAVDLVAPRASIADAAVGWVGGMVVSPSGELLWCDRDNGRILHTDPETGTTTVRVAGLAAPADVALAPDAALYILDGGRLVRIRGGAWAAYRCSGSDAGAFVWPSSLCVLPDGRLVVADTGNHRVQVLDPATLPFAPIEPGAIPAGRWDPLRTHPATYAVRPVRNVAATPIETGPPLPEPPALAADGVALRPQLRGGRAVGVVFDASMHEAFGSVEWLPGAAANRLRFFAGADGPLWEFSDWQSTNGRLVPDPESWIRVVQRYDRRLVCRVHLRVASWTPGSEGAGEDFFRFCVASATGANLWYQGGFTLPMPELDPYPYEMAERLDRDIVWRRHGEVFELPVAACPLPAFGQWAPDAGTLLAFVLQRDRLTNNAGFHLAFLGQVAHDDRPAWFSLSVPTITRGHPPLREGAFDREAWLDLEFDLWTSAQATADRRLNGMLLPRIWRDDRDLLPPPPVAVPDVAFLPPVVRRNHFGYHWLLRHEFDGHPFDPTTDAKWVGCPEAPTICPRFSIRTGLLAPGGSAALASRIPGIAASAAHFTLEGDACTAWNQWQDAQQSPESATIYNGVDNWWRGQYLLAAWHDTGDASVLPLLDGLVRFTKHMVYTRGGIWVDPWAHFAFSGGVGSDFLLAYYHAFRDDPARGALAREARDLAVDACADGLFVYLSDPDPIDRRDPTGLLQPINVLNWFGTVSWAETGPVWASAIAAYVETGAPWLRHLILWHYAQEPIGWWDSLDGAVCENLWGGAAGRQYGAKGGIWPETTALTGRLYAEPIPPATVRLLVGRAAAMTFGRGRDDVRVTAFGCAEPAAWAVVLDGSGAVEALHVTAPHRDLRGLPVFVNEVPAGATRVVYSALGEDLLLRDVPLPAALRLGPATVAAEPLVVAVVGENRPSTHDDLVFVALPETSRCRLSHSWCSEYGGLYAKDHRAGGIPFRLAGDGVVEVVSLAHGATIPLPRCTAQLFLVTNGAGTSGTGPIVRTADGMRLPADFRGLAATGFPLGRWALELWQVSVPRGAHEVALTGSGFLFAATARLEQPVPEGSVELE